MVVIWAKLVLFGQNGSIWAKWFCLGKNSCNLGKIIPLCSFKGYCAFSVYFRQPPRAIHISFYVEAFGESASLMRDIRWFHLHLLFVHIVHDVSTKCS